MEMISTNPRKIMRDALKESGILQTELAEKLHITQASISGNMNRTKIGMDVFVRMLEGMGYNVVVGKKTADGFEPIWEVATEE